LVSARRNTIEGIEKSKTAKKKTENYYSQVYPPYQYFLPISPLATLNAKWRLGSVDRVKIVDTKFESTSLLIAYGRDVFVTKVQPDLTFDLLNEEFNYELLALACLVITVRLADPGLGGGSPSAEQEIRGQKALPRCLTWVALINSLAARSDVLLTKLELISLY
jgi:hypothetical protein